MTGPSSSVTSLTTFPGLPRTNDLSGITLFSVTRGSQEPIRNADGDIIRWPECSDSGLGFILRDLLSKTSEVNLHKMVGFVDQNAPQVIKIRSHFYNSFVIIKF